MWPKQNVALPVICKGLEFPHTWRTLPWPNHVTNKGDVGQ